MRDLSRINKILSKLELLWKNNPDLRFTQLISWLDLKLDVDDSYYVEDDITLLALEDLTKNITSSEFLYNVSNNHIDEFILDVKKRYSTLEIEYVYVWSDDIFSISYWDVSDCIDNEFQSYLDSCSEKLYSKLENFIIDESRL